MFKELFTEARERKNYNAYDNAQVLWKAEYYKNGKLVEKNERFITPGKNSYTGFLKTLTKMWGNVPKVDVDEKNFKITFTYNK